jgi:LysR family transcriptional activator of nhaA
VVGVDQEDPLRSSWAVHGRTVVLLALVGNYEILTSFVVPTDMDWLNYQHVRYFAAIVREGGLARAGEALHLTHSTLSAQLRELEAFLGAPLFERRGRRLLLTPFGETIAGYAAELERVGAELLDVARGSRSGPRLSPLRVGLVDALPRTTGFRLIEPALTDDPRPLLQMHHGPLQRLLGALSENQLHLVLADQPAPEGLSRALHSHLLGRSDVLLYATQPLAARCRARFPASLDGAPMVLPAVGTGLRRSLEGWLSERALRPVVVAEAEDAAMMRVLGVRGLGVFPVRAALKAEVEDLAGVALVGSLEGVSESYYAIAHERRVKHPGVAAIIAAGRAGLTVTTPTTKPTTEARRSPPPGTAGPRRSRSRRRGGDRG